MISYIHNQCKQFEYLQNQHKYLTKIIKLAIQETEMAFLFNLQHPLCIISSYTCSRRSFAALSVLLWSAHYSRLSCRFFELKAQISLNSECNGGGWGGDGRNPECKTRKSCKMNKFDLEIPSI